MLKKIFLTFLIALTLVNPCLLVNPCFAVTQLNINQVKNLQTTLDAKALKTTTVNGHALSSNVTVTATDVGAPTISSGTAAPTSTPAKVGDIYVDTTLKQTYVSNGTTNSADWIKQNGSNIMNLGCTSRASIVAGTTYHWGRNTSAGMLPTGSGEAGAKTYILRAGTITKCYSTFGQTAGATNETSSLYIRVNDTTDYLVSNAVVNNTWFTYQSNTSLNIPVNAGDYIWIKWVTAASYVTAPTAINNSSLIEIDY